MKVPLHDAIRLRPAPRHAGCARPAALSRRFWADQLANRHIDRLAPSRCRAIHRVHLFRRVRIGGRRQVPQPPTLVRSDATCSTGSASVAPSAIRLHGALALFNDDMTAALCSAVNDWMARELLDHEPRLRASILVPATKAGPRCAGDRTRRRDRRFVQVLLLAMGETPLGGARTGRSMQRPRSTSSRSASTPAAPTGLHQPTQAGPPTGWRITWRNRRRFETQLLSLVAEGVFQKFPS